MTRPLIIVCDWIPPAFGAVGQYELARARDAARAGRPTTIIGLAVAATNSDEVVPAEVTGGAPLRIVRLGAKPVRKSNLALRALWTLQTGLRLVGRTIGSLKARDQAELKVTGSPPFISYLLIALNIVFLRRTLTYRTTDFYPETAFASGKALFLKPALPVFHWLRRRAHILEALSECQQRRLLESGVAQSRVSIVRDKSPVNFSAGVQAAQRPYPADKLIVLYSGNLGIAHDINTFAEAYRQHVHSGPNRVRLWLNGTGTKVEALAAFCRQHDLPIHITPPAPLEQLAGVLLAADVHLVTLGKPFWGYVIPSKIYGSIDSGKPVLFIGPRESDVHELIAPVQGCMSVRNGDVAGCLNALSAFSVQHAAQRDQVDGSTQDFRADELDRPRPPLLSATP